MILRLIFIIGTHEIRSIYLEGEDISKIYPDGEEIMKFMCEIYAHVQDDIMIYINLAL